MTTEMIADANLNGGRFGVFYSPAGKGIFSAERIQRAACVFLSPPIDGTSSLLSWKSVSWSATCPPGTRVYVYYRSAGTEADLGEAEWKGPATNSGDSLRDLNGRMLQVALVAYSAYASGVMSSPFVDSISAACFLKSDEQKFFSRKIQLGFRPKHVLLTYNGTIPEGALVRFAVSGTDSTNESEFQFVEVNKVEELDSISWLSDGIKVMISGISSREIPFEIDEFALAFSGDEAVKVNKP